jgi:hypothetical protein
MLPASSQPPEKPTGVNRCGLPLKEEGCRWVTAALCGEIKNGWVAAGRGEDCCGEYPSKKINMTPI